MSLVNVLGASELVEPSARVLRRGLRGVSISLDLAGISGSSHPTTGPKFVEP